MAIGRSPTFDSSATGFELCSARLLLGITLDSELSFVPFARSLLARGRALFDDLYQAAEAGGFPVPVLAAQVPQRVESAIMFGAALLLGVPRIESDLNNLQSYWARVTLGCRRGPRLPWALSRAQCGWGRRLGTRMLEEVVMARARVWLLPHSHPAAVLREAARVSPAPSWW